MDSTPGTHVIRCLALAALAVSAALLVNHVSPNPALCGYESDCDEVLFSPYGSLLGVPLPLVGVAAFGILFGASLFPAGRGGRLVRPLALAAGVAGLALIFVQLVALRRLCRFCLLVDLAAIAMAVVELTWRRGQPARDLRLRPLWLVGAGVALGLGAALGTAGSGDGNQDRPVPPQVRALWVADKVNVVEVADFDCRHCRQMHAIVSQFIAEEGDRVHFVRLTAPMPGHAQARPASRAFLCACQQGKGDDMAEALFRAPSLGPEDCERLAGSLGLSLPAFRTCTAAPETESRLDSDVAWVKAASPGGLPIVWVQERMFVGVQPIGALRAASEARQH
jgi:uncharacterized membrane protein